MIVSKKAILAKTQGRCAYCAALLTVHTMQRDHVEPIVRFRNVRWSFSGRTGCKYPANHRLENIVAACKKCNADKGACDLETWRASLRWPGWRQGITFYFEKVVSNETPRRSCKSQGR